MSLTPNTFTRANIENVLLEGRPFDSYPSFANPVLIIKIGAPGSGKSSAASKAKVAELGVNQDDAIIIDIDKVNASFRTFRNNTRKIRNRYRNRTNFNNAFYNTLSAVHNTHIHLKNRATRSRMINHTDALMFKAIKQRKHIIRETIRPITRMLSNYKDALQKYGYRIYVIYHKAPKNVLNARIHARGEELYRTEGYYRVFDPRKLQGVIDELEENVTTYIKPMVSSGEINGYFEIE